jgi:predicted enzyme related to lactoylglutathione lyase
MTHVHGPDFLALQVRDLESAAVFYEQEIGLARAPTPPGVVGVVVFKTSTIPFAVREPLPGTNLDSGQPGLGVSLSLRVDDAQALHNRLKDSGVSILSDPFDTPFGRTFVFRDPDGYAVAIHGASSIERSAPMCRNIRTLANFEPPATDDEVRAAALQFVRKVSGMNRPSRANEAAFERAVDEVTEAATRLLHSLTTAAPPRNREVEALKARERARRRFA